MHDTPDMAEKKEAKLFVRMTPKLEAAIGAWATDYRKRTGENCTASDAARKLMAAALGVDEEGNALEKPKPRKK